MGSKDKNGEYVVVEENVFNQQGENCTVINYNTGYQVYLSSLNLKVSRRWLLEKIWHTISY